MGKFKDEIELDEYLYFEFSRDFEVHLDECNQPEYVVEDIDQSPRELLDGFSQSEHFLELAIDMANRKHINNVNTAFIYYGTHFEEYCYEAMTEVPVNFLGNFSW